MWHASMGTSEYPIKRIMEEADDNANDKVLKHGVLEAGNQRFAHGARGVVQYISHMR